MMEWSKGGWTGSVNRLVRSEVREQVRNNPVVRQLRYGVQHGMLRRLFGLATFQRFFVAYFVFDLAVIALEIVVTVYCAKVLPDWAASSDYLKSLILNTSSYLVAAQGATLGVISLGLALVTLIAEREGSSTDVQVYYHESLAFEIVASSLALLAVLCIQFLWPMQFALHRFGFGTDSQLFKLILIVAHLVWLIMNLAAVAYFVATTFRFVQQSAREQLRERYTANVVWPRDMTDRLRAHFYGLASEELLPKSPSGGSPQVTFGFDFGEPKVVEVEADFGAAATLHDVRMIWVRWVLCRWSSRSLRHASIHQDLPAGGLAQIGPQIWFTLHMGDHVKGRIGWCRRRGGVPLTSVEKFVLRRAFRFRSVKNDA